jgi:hypothetical protein
MKRETVKPMPATVATPISDVHGTVSGKCPSPRRVASQLAPVMPTSLPTTRPQTIPIVMGDETARPSTPPPRSTPAFASANSGTITKLVTGWKRFWSRSFGEIASVTPRTAERAYSGVGCSRNDRHRDDASSSSSRDGG